MKLRALLLKYQNGSNSASSIELEPAPACRIPVHGTSASAAQQDEEVAELRIKLARMEEKQHQQEQQFQALLLQQHQQHQQHQQQQEHIFHQRLAPLSLQQHEPVQEQPDLLRQLQFQVQQLQQFQQLQQGSAPFYQQGSAYCQPAGLGGGLINMFICPQGGQGPMPMPAISPMLQRGLIARSGGGLYPF